MDRGCVMVPIYFSKVEYVENLGYGMRKSVMLLDLEKKELSYQVFVPAKREMPAIQGIETFETENYSDTYDVSFPARVIRNGKTGFKRQLIKEEWDKYEIVFSDGIKITDEQMKKLLPYCNVLDFEPYRDKEMSMKDEGYIGYRDEIDVNFTAITNSHIPKLELPMDYYYDEEHIWPSEKLYRYLVQTFFENKKKFSQYGPTYGGYSLFWR